MQSIPAVLKGVNSSNSFSESLSPLLSPSVSAPPSSLPCPSSGTLHLYHTINAFTSSSKSDILASSAQSLLKEILTSSDPTPSLNKFELLVYADLKKWKFWYWNAVPSLVVRPGWEIDIQGEEGAETIEERSWRKAEVVLGKEKVS